MQYIVQEDQAGQRLDLFVATNLSQLSRAFVQKLCEEGRVLVNGIASKPGHRLRQEDSVEVDYDEAEFGRVDHIDLPVIYEDDDVVVIDKPAGVLTHALALHGNEASVASFLRAKVQGLEGERAGIVHRLDRATSGVIIGAKSQKAVSMLQKQFSQRKVKKTYVAVVEGHLDPEEAVIDMPIERNPKAPATFRVGPNGKPSRTHYKVLAESSKYSLIELKPETGRTHQLRVHLAKIGHPIVGDPLYGTGQYGDRLFLHALGLEITLPGGERKTFVAPLPVEFEEQIA
ncbi:MAG TPA: RluA family pseudouridine synthase [Candidatus Pristimantibacillus sp.]|jgi:23S rRNA pseudouridine1911/1915/1917 synthase|nr:RluA family pseudouridine synthase [Candidatus Pristimantibacillus sp.]